MERLSLTSAVYTLCPYVNGHVPCPTLEDTFKWLMNQAQEGQYLLEVNMYFIEAFVKGI